MEKNGVERKKRVLITDDEERIRRIIRKILERWDYEVEEASDGEEAIQEIRRSKFDLLICDIRMPKVDGWQVLRAVKTNPKTSDLPIIVLTGIQDENDMFKCYDYGAGYYITKPFTAHQLLYGVRLMFGEAEDYWKALDSSTQPIAYRAM